jgi:hypothetical protein
MNVTNDDDILWSRFNMMQMARFYSHEDAVYDSEEAGGHALQIE